MDKATFFDADIHKTAKVGNVVDDAGQQLSLPQIGNFLNILIKGKHLGLFAKVQSWFFQFF